uniref:Secreted protein n=1 Tax=Panagrellus redivivus TaxID=6233 RepID=A0A7E4W8L1_PANRE
MWLYLLFLTAFPVGIFASQDLVLACQPGYKVSAVKRVNSHYQKDVAGSLTIECERVLDGPKTASEVTCAPLMTTPQCTGVSEGCGGNTWLGGFQAFVVENTTNAVLLDPICCSSPEVKIDAISCATERLNNAKQPFEHAILADNLVYRGIHCWHQYNSNNTLVDLVWKLEICQYTSDQPPPERPFSLEHCPPCDCHCGIDVCGNGHEPVRLIHRITSTKKCSCDCMCHFECP